MVVRNGHRVLVATPLDPAALDRLRAFFVVDEAAGGDVECALDGKAGIVTDEALAFDAARIGRLPRLQAVSVVGPAHAQLDLPALTEAGIRATNLPLDDDALRVEALWRELERRLRLTGDGDAAPARGAMRPMLRAGARLGRSLASIAIAFEGNDALSVALAARAAGAGLRVLVDGERRPDFRVTTTSSTAGAADSARIDLGAVLGSVASAEALRALRDRIAAEGLIAALGFGRDSFHPPYLLNPEIACTSCC
jgi:phosphoglycerate dehydrogenase-like enzyme